MASAEAGPDADWAISCEVAPAHRERAVPFVIERLAMIAEIVHQIMTADVENLCRSLYGESSA